MAIRTRRDTPRTGQSTRPRNAAGTRGRLALGCALALLLAAVWPLSGMAALPYFVHHKWVAEACDIDNGIYFERFDGIEYGCLLGDGDIVCHVGADCVWVPNKATLTSGTTVRGIVGDGEVPAASGRVQFVLAVSSLSPQSATGTVPRLIGHVIWGDPSRQLTLQSIEITAYGPLAGVTGGRRTVGWMRVNGGAGYPFVLRAVDSGPAGSGKDQIELLVGAAASKDLAATGTPVAAAGGFTYQASGTLVTGDLNAQTIHVGAPSTPGTPAP